MRDFCTYFDEHYLSKGLALYESLARVCPEFRLWVLCLDAATHDILAESRLPHLRLITLRELEAHDTRLSAAREHRSRIEYYFTCTPFLPRYVFEHDAAVDMVTYVDADLCFFSSPEPMFADMADRSIALIKHGFSEGLEEMERASGTFNVGWVSFRRDARAIACLRWWGDQCLEWCHDHAEDGRFADQKYLDRWPDLFEGVMWFDHPGVGLAPWNLAGRRIEEREGRLWVDDQPLVFYHFHGLRPIAAWLFDSNLSTYKIRLSGTVRRRIYRPYVQQLTDLRKRNHRPDHSHSPRPSLPRGTTRTFRDVVHSVLMFDCVPIIGGHSI